jgi:hypothetical protein
MDWNYWRDRVHKTAVEHGFYDKPVPFEQIISLIHSELSEALEEMRTGNPAAYVMRHAYESAENGICDTSSTKITDVEGWKTNEKPCGVAVELTDAIIRILDYFGYANIDASEIEPMVYEDEDDDGEIVTVEKTPMYIIADAHSLVSAAWKERNSKFGITCELTDAAGACMTLIEQLGCNVEELIKIKSEYNESRPPKHGKAF